MTIVFGIAMVAVARSYFGFQNFFQIVSNSSVYTEERRMLLVICFAARYFYSSLAVFLPVG